MSCLLCGKETRPVLDLGRTALANELHRTRYAVPETFPLALEQCGTCAHLQLSAVSRVPKERLYTQSYPYRSVTSKAHLIHLASILLDRFSPSTVLDIGSNDGEFLRCFPDDVSCVGYDPAGPDMMTPELCLYQSFFDEQSGTPGRHSDLITALNVFAHNADLYPMLRGVKKILAPAGTFVIEVAYALPMLRDGIFDLIYHEHVHHWHATPALAYFREHGLELYDAERIPVHGGSLRMYVRHAKKGKPVQSDALQDILAQEKVSMPHFVDEFPARVAANRAAAMAWAKKMRRDEMRIGVLGWPAKACTLISHYGIAKDIHRVYDDNPEKVGKYTQHGHLIGSTDYLHHYPVDRLLVASWNYADDLTAKWSKEYKKKFVVPLPTWRLA